MSVFPVLGIVVVGPHIHLEWMNKCQMSKWCLRIEGGGFVGKGSPCVAQAGKGKPRGKGKAWVWNTREQQDDIGLLWEQ